MTSLSFKRYFVFVLGLIKFPLKDVHLWETNPICFLNGILVGHFPGACLSRCIWKLNPRIKKTSTVLTSCLIDRFFFWYKNPSNTDQEAAVGLAAPAPRLVRRWSDKMKHHLIIKAVSIPVSWRVWWHFTCENISKTTWKQQERIIKRKSRFNKHLPQGEHKWCSYANQITNKHLISCI